MNRMARRYVASTVLLAGVLTACSDEPPPDKAPSVSSAWETLTDRLGPDGEVPLDVALDAFATLVGPVDGGEVVGVPGPEMTSGTPAVRWVLGHWDQLTAAQRQDVDEGLGLGPGGTVGSGTSMLLAEAGAGGDLTLEQIVAEVAAELTARFPRFTSLPRVVTSTRKSKSGVLAWTYPLAGAKKAVGSDIPTACRIDFFGGAVHFHDLYLDHSDPTRSQNALLRLRMTSAHELMHCHQLSQSPTPKEYYKSPPWVAEGSAQWGEYMFAFGDTPPPQPLESWKGYFKVPKQDLFTSDYDAIGFWSHAENPWDLLAFAMQRPWATDFPSAGASVLAEKDRSSKPLESYAMAFTRQPSLGTGWEASGPGLLDERPPASKTVILGVGTRHTGSVPKRGFAYETVRLKDDVDVLYLSSKASGAIHWGTAADGPDDLIGGAGTDQWFCVAAGGCVCPDGTSPTSGLALLARPFREASTAFFGAQASGKPSPTSRTVRMAADGFDRLVEKLCADKAPGAVPVVDACSLYSQPQAKALLTRMVNGRWPVEDVLESEVESPRSTCMWMDSFGDAVWIEDVALEDWIEDELAGGTHVSGVGDDAYLVDVGGSSRLYFYVGPLLLSAEILLQPGDDTVNALIALGAIIAERARSLCC